MNKVVKRKGKIITKKKNGNRKKNEITKKFVDPIIFLPVNLVT